MTPQEQQMLQDLTARINSTVLHDKDAEAEQFLAQTLGRNPDALYILAQTVLVQQYALDQAKKQLDDLRNAPAAQPAKHTSFLGNLLGMSDEPARPAPPPPPAPYQTPQSGYQPVYNAPPQQQYAQGYGGGSFGSSPFGGGGQQGGFLRSAMQTATGVAAGALAFEGIESLMHGFGHHAGYGGGSGFGDFGGGSGAPREEIVNNYYGDSHSGQQGISSDIEDRRDDSSFNDSLAQNDPDDFAATSDDTSSSFDDSMSTSDPDDFSSSSDDSN